jgi:hypothetical protein
MPDEFFSSDPRGAEINKQLLERIPEVGPKKRRLSKQQKAHQAVVAENKALTKEVTRLYERVQQLEAKLKTIATAFPEQDSHYAVSED